MHTRKQDGVAVEFETDETLFSPPSVGRIYALYAYRPGVLVVESANALITPGPEPNN